MDTSVVLTWPQVTALRGSSLHVAAAPGNEVIYADTAADIAALTSAQIAELHAVGVTNIVAGPPPGTTADMIMQNGGGAYEIYDIGNSAILAADQLSEIDPAFQVVDLGGFDSTDTSDILLRSSKNGTFVVDDVANNAITDSATLGKVGLNWQVASFADFQRQFRRNRHAAADSNDGQRPKSMISAIMRSPSPHRWARWGWSGRPRASAIFPARPTKPTC